MFTRIVVPLDGTGHAELALPVAARIARATGGSLLLIRVVLPPIEYGTYGLSQTMIVNPTPYECVLDEASIYLRAVLDRNESLLAGIKTETEATSGATYPAIFQEARLYHADLIVLCSRGETGLKRWVFSSVAQQSVRHSPIPVLVLNEHGFFPPFQQEDRPLRVLLPLDGSSLSETALEPTVRFIAALAGSQQAVLHMLRAVGIPFPYGRTRSFSHVDKMMQEEDMQKAQSYLHDAIGRVQAMLPVGLNLTVGSSMSVDIDPAMAILTETGATEEVQSAQPYDLIAMATHGRSGVQLMLMGSVTEHLLGATHLPLLIVRPSEQAAWQKGQREETVSVTRRANT
jgi:nucleotide-binding universal stress UspA family protein